MKGRIFLFLAFVAALAFTACGPGDATDDNDYGQITNPIYYGSPPDRPEHDAVVGLHQLANGYVYVTPFCSGTLIDDHTVVTAAHCLDAARATAPKFKTIAPSAVAVYVGNDPAVDILDHLYFVEDVQIYPGYNRKAIRNDIGLLRLSAAITEPVTPVPALPAAIGFTTGDVGSLLNIAGFGETETGTTGVKLQIDVPLAGLGCAVDGCPDPGDAATQIAYLQYEGGPCFGDSGGPAFFYRDGAAYVGGITSYGDRYCSIYGVSTRVDAFQGWIDDYLAPPITPDCSADGFCNPECAAGADPDCAVTPGDCGNGVCDAGESCDGRDGTVDCPADCAGVTTGKPSGRYCFVGDTCIGQGCP